eukprot:Lankesteria_metandrocarpae@DN7102_c0_g1_i1.p1
MSSGRTNKAKLAESDALQALLHRHDVYPLSRSGLVEWLKNIYAPTVLIVPTENARLCLASSNNISFVDLFQPVCASPGAKYMRRMCEAVCSSTSCGRERAFENFDKFGALENVQLRAVDKIRNLSSFGTRFLYPEDMVMPLDFDRVDAAIYDTAVQCSPSYNSLGIQLAADGESVDAACARIGEQFTNNLHTSHSSSKSSALAHHSSDRKHDSLKLSKQPDTNATSDNYHTNSNTPVSPMHSPIDPSSTRLLRPGTNRFSAGSASTGNMFRQHPLDSTWSRSCPKINTNESTGDASTGDDSTRGDNTCDTSKSRRSAGDNFSTMWDVPNVWWESWNEVFYRSLDFGEHELLSLPVAVIYVVSSLDEDPVNAFEELNNLLTYRPLGMYDLAAHNPARAYLYVHDFAACSSRAATLEPDYVAARFEQVRDAFPPANCHLLQMNSAPQPTGRTSSGTSSSAVATTASATGGGSCVNYGINDSTDTQPPSSEMLQTLVARHLPVDCSGRRDSPITEFHVENKSVFNGIPVVPCNYFPLTRAPSYQVQASSANSDKFTSNFDGIFPPNFCRSLSFEDLFAVQDVLHSILVDTVVPFIERKLSQTESLVSQQRRGLRNHFRNFLRGSRKTANLPGAASLGTAAGLTKTLPKSSSMNLATGATASTSAQQSSDTDGRTTSKIRNNSNTNDSNNNSPFYPMYSALI